MANRELPFGEDEIPARQRRRLNLEGDFDAAPPPRPPFASFDSLNNDCLIHILSHLNYESMNVVAFCSRACREARRNESLDQTRVRTIVCSATATARSVYDILAEWRDTWEQPRHPIHLRIENAPNIRPDPDNPELPGDWWRAYDRIVSIDFSIGDPEHAAADRQVDFSSLEFIFPICSNTRKLDMSGLRIADADSLFAAISPGDCPNLRLLTWNNSDRILNLSGAKIRNLRNMTLFMDDSCFRAGATVSADVVSRAYQRQERIGVRVSDDGGTEFYLMMNATGLEGLSIKNATWHVDDNPAETFPVSQEMLIKMVRNHQTLQWLRSDLSAENVAMLQRERPDITFVSD